MTAASDIRRLRAFKGAGYNKGRPVPVQALWFAVQHLFFIKWWCPPVVRPYILRVFGARIGRRVFIRHGVRVLWPWKLSIGDDSWIGEGVWVLNLEPITIGRDVCVSQEAFLCTGSHDRSSPSFEYDNGPIAVEDQVWIGARATVLRGVTVGRGSVIPACARVTRSIEALDANGRFTKNTL